MLFKPKQFIQPPPTLAGSAFIASEQYFHTPGTLVAMLGKGADGMPFCVDLAKMPHTLIAGTTGSGKSVMLQCILASLLTRYGPSQLQLIMIDTKRVELGPYKRIKHLPFDVAKTAKDAILQLAWACREMGARYQNIERQGKRSFDGMYTPTLIVIEELADLMLDKATKKQIESLIVRIAQLGRAAGIYLLMATQRPSVDVVTGLIKANIPGRICMTVASWRDSMVMLDQRGAEDLNGRGDCLVMIPGQRDLQRVQGEYISENNTDKLIAYWKDKRQYITR